MQDKTTTATPIDGPPAESIEEIPGSTLSLPYHGKARSEGHVTIDTFLRGSQLYIDINAAADPAEAGRIVAYRVRETGADGLPDWLRCVRHGFLCGEPPVQTAEIGLVLQVLRRDDPPLHFAFVVNCRTGALHAEGDETRPAGRAKDD